MLQSEFGSQTQFKSYDDLKLDRHHFDIYIRPIAHYTHTIAIGTDYIIYYKINAISKGQIFVASWYVTK